MCEQIIHDGNSKLSFQGFERLRRQTWHGNYQSLCFELNKILAARLTCCKDLACREFKLAPTFVNLSKLASKARSKREKPLAAHTHRATRAHTAEHENQIYIYTRVHIPCISFSPLVSLCTLISFIPAQTAEMQNKQRQKLALVN